ncbi:hypothetical protein ACWXVL_01155 [Mycoplasma sp. 128]|uniref:hypothetical protein n=1 Tax=Mycoplasma sp. 3341 TaxID=3447506 RepID=UPI003F66036E
MKKKMKVIKKFLELEKRINFVARQIIEIYKLGIDEQDLIHNCWVDIEKILSNTNDKYLDVYLINGIKFLFMNWAKKAIGKKRNFEITMSDFEENFSDVCDEEKDFSLKNLKLELTMLLNMSEKEKAIFENICNQNYNNRIMSQELKISPYLIQKTKDRLIASIKDLVM